MMAMIVRFQNRPRREDPIGFREEAGDNGLPGEHGSEIKKDIEEHIGPAHIRIRERIEAPLTIPSCNSIDERTPSHVDENKYGHDNKPGAHDDKLEKIGDKDGKH